MEYFIFLKEEGLNPTSGSILGTAPGTYVSPFSFIDKKWKTERRTKHAIKQEKQLVR